MSEPVPSSALPRGLSPLGYRNFAFYWVGTATTTSGRWIELTGILWFVYELTNSPLLVGMIGAARALPALVLSPFAGVIADRLDQRLLLVTTQCLGMACTLSLVALIALEVIELWHVYIQVVVQTAINSFDAAARQALYPRLVPRGELPRAITLNITASRFSKFLGPASAGFLIAEFGVLSPFVINAATFFVMILAMVAIPGFKITDTRHQGGFARELFEGIQHILSAPVLRGILTLEVVFSLFEMNPAMIAIIGREIFDVGPKALGMMLSAPAFGAFFGIAWLLYSQRMGRQGRLSIACMLVYACILGVLSTAPTYVGALLALGAIGVLEVLVTATRTTIMQLAAPPHLRGRLMANMGTITRGAGPMAETQSGFLTSVIGPTMALLVAAGAVGAAACLVAARNRELWQFSLDGSTSKRG